MSQLTLYTTGTITFTNGSADLTGVGTNFIGLQQGDLVLAPDDKWYELAAAPTDNLAATLDRTYTGATATNSPGGAWVIMRSSVARDSVRTATKQLTDISSIWRQVMSLTQSDQLAKFSKALTTDRAGMVLQKALVDLFQVGTFQDDDFSIRYLVASTWTKAFGVNPTTGAASIYSQLLLGTTVTPLPITGLANDYAPAGIDKATVLRVSTNNPQTMTGLTGGANGRVLVMMNVGANDLTLEDEGGPSAAANRFRLMSNMTLPANGSILLVYDGTISRWRVVGGAGEGGGGSTGEKGWSPILAYVSNGSGGTVAKIIDWAGGGGTKPATGSYIGPTGLVATAAEAVSVIGPQGNQVQFQMSGRVLQWSYTGTVEWQNLFDLGVLVGPTAATEWAFKTATADADPGTGKIAFDNAAFGSITQLFVSKNERYGADVSVWINTWDDSTSVTNKGYLTLIDTGLQSSFAKFKVTGNVVVSGNYFKVPVAPIAGDIPADTHMLSVLFSATGDASPDGAEALTKVNAVIAGAVGGISDTLANVLASANSYTDDAANAAIAHADTLNTAMDTRVDALEVTVGAVTSGTTAGVSDTLVNVLNTAQSRAAGLAIALG
ncbi:hypothetical protein IVB12_16090 [Bradyrhizobium sp. 179]|uniref:hypothetical protein n=1 Tax=Bradyrhizobium sp. 179 TaxID=2782648 RepID=UPI001FFBDA0B|nr:hypothetical protein [Bradyrhizobium sp. 179]MCK1543438.1 hypothetical protein [Bradyrhizobium sp. 179]